MRPLLQEDVPFWCLGEEISTASWNVECQHETCLAWSRLCTLLTRVWFCQKVQTKCPIDFSLSTVLILIAEVEKASLGMTGPLPKMNRWCLILNINMSMTRTIDVHQSLHGFTMFYWLSLWTDMVFSWLSHERRRPQFHFHYIGVCYQFMWNGMATVGNYSEVLDAFNFQRPTLTPTTLYWIYSIYTVIYIDNHYLNPDWFL